MLASLLLRPGRSPAFTLPTGTAQLAALLCVLLINSLVADHFFAITLQDGRLFGSLIDVINRGAPVAILAIGIGKVIPSFR